MSRAALWISIACGLLTLAHCGGDAEPGTSGAQTGGAGGSSADHGAAGSTAAGSGGDSFGGGSGGGSGDSSATSGGSTGTLTGGASGDGGTAGVFDAAGGTGASGGTGDASGGTGGTGMLGECDFLSGCPSGQYCNSSTWQCTSCQDLSRFRFRRPQRLANATFEARRFPRPTANYPEIYYTRGPDTELWKTPDCTSSDGTWQAGGITGDRYFYGGPLVTYEPLANLTTSGTRFVHRKDTFGWSELRVSTPLPAPFNTGDQNSSTRSWNANLAIASNVQRVWWMTNRNGPVELVTMSLTGGADTLAPVTIDVGGGCNRAGEATPWVHPSGNFMLFNSREHDTTSCDGQRSDSTDLFFVSLDPATGQPTETATAEPFVDVNQADSWDTDPALSPDLCWLLFATDRPPSGSFRNRIMVYRASRQ